MEAGATLFDITTFVFADVASNVTLSCWKNCDGVGPGLFQAVLFATSQVFVLCATRSTPPVHTRLLELRLATTRSTSPVPLLRIKVARVVAGSGPPNVKFGIGPVGTGPLSLTKLPYFINVYVPGLMKPFKALRPTKLLPERVTVPPTFRTPLGVTSPVGSSDKPKELVAPVLTVSALEMVNVPPWVAKPGLIVPLLVTPLPLIAPTPPRT